MRHQNLIETEGLLKHIMIFMTNQQYAGGNKISYNYSWTKGTKAIDDGTGKVLKNYYILNFFLIDKTESPVGKQVDLATMFYPTQPGISLEALEEKALKELLLNGIQSLANITYAMYKRQLEKDHVKAEDVKIDEKIEQLRESVETPKLFIP